MTGDDIFQLFEIKHNFLLDKLDFDKQTIEEEIKLYANNRVAADRIVNNVRKLETW